MIPTFMCLGYVCDISMSSFTILTSHNIQTDCMRVHLHKVCLYHLTAEFMEKHFLKA